jgi:hypothetical protein
VSQRGHFTKKVIDHGNTVWIALEQNPGGLTMADLTELCELSQAQIRKAFEYIRDIFASDQQQPIVFIPGRHKNVYKLAVQPVESEDDLRRRIATWALQIKRARTAIAQPSMAKFGRTVTLQRVTRYMEVLEGELGNLLDGELAIWF